MGRGISLGVSGWRLQGQRTGVGRYVLNLIGHWTEDVARSRFDGVTVYAPSPVAPARGFPSGVEARILPPSMPMIAWENLRLGPIDRHSVMLYPSYSRPLITRGASVVVTHDATMRLHPELFTRQDKFFYGPLYGWSARHATLVITTTEAARGDIAREWNVDPDKIRVTHLAADKCFRQLPQSVDRRALRVRLTGSDAPYFLFVGKLSGRRNLPRLLEAFAQLKTAYATDYRLMIVGPQYAISEVEKMADSLKVRDSLVTKTFVADEELNELYNAADVFVMPSTYETVSFPIMEAQAAGTPVICVDTPGAREMTGGDALLIPRLDVRDLVDGMRRLAMDEALRREIAHRGLANAKRFSWERCASLTLDICAEAATMKGASR